MTGRLRWLCESAIAYARDALMAARAGWRTFWFTPANPATLCLIRVLAGAMLFYTHAVWTLELEAFFGESSWQSLDLLEKTYGDGFAWSVLAWCHSPIALWAFHLFALASFALLTIGFMTRVTSVVAFVCTVSYAYRSPAALYGLDQINGLLSLYLIIGPCGARYSVDAWLARRAGRSVVNSSVTANLAIRLMQCHLCVIYLFAGLSKLQGVSWWDGSAIWRGAANQEYQTIDLTWLAGWPLLVNVLTHATVAWEISYCVLIWNRWARPLMLLGAIGLHLGIVAALGMPTFGLAMLLVNAAFLPPEFVEMLLRGVRTADAIHATSPQRDVSDRLSNMLRRVDRVLVGSVAQPNTPSVANHHRSRSDNARR